MSNLKGTFSVRDTDYDFIGAGASVLCMIHCLLTPFLFAAQATVSSSCSEISPMWWKMVDYVFLIFTFFAIHYTSKASLLKWIPNVLYALWTILALLLVNKFYNLISIPHAIIYIPAISLTVLHLYNRNYCRCYKDKCCI